MGIKFKSPLALSAHRAIAHSDSAQTLEVTVVTKTSAHPEFGNGSVNGYAIDGVEGPYLEFTPGNTYKFDQSDSSNTGHPLAFYEDAAKTISYTTGVTTNGTPGGAGAYTQIVPTVSTPPILYYQCIAHSLMGSYTKFGTGSQGDTYTFSASQDGDNVDLLLDAGSGTDSTVQLTAGTNITLTRNSASEVTIDAAGGSGGAAESALKILLTVKNVSGGSLSPGTLVRVAPTANPPSGNVLEVDIADNSSASTMPAIGIIVDTLADEAEGECVAFGRATGFSTLGYTEGDPIWVGTNGAFTGTKPTGTALIQRVGQVIKIHATNGSIEVFGAGRSNDVPNIPQDQLWLGNSSGVATPTAHTVENISNVTVSSKQNGQALVWDAANNYWKNGTVSGGGGGGGTELSIERNVFTATANQTAFTISSAITASSNTQVYIDGVYQAKSNYTTSGSTITFSTGVPVGSEVEVIHFISVLSKVYTDTFTGNGTEVDFTASKDVTDENVTQVYIDGVYQSKDNYTTSGTTITFSTAPPSGSAIEVVHFTPATYSTLNSNQFTGTGSQTDFTLTQAVEEDKSFVFIQGIYQEKSTYSISGTTLTFTTAPQSGYTVEVITVGEVSILPDTIDIDNFSGTGSQVDFVLTSTPSTENAIDVYINGLYQQKDTFSLSGNTLTFSTAPPNGSTIEVKHQFVASVKGEVTLTAGTGISVTKNSSNNFTIENTLVDVTVSFNTPTGQGLTYTTPNSSSGQAGSVYGPQTFTITDGSNILSGTASISGLPNGLTVDSQSYNNSGAGNILTITLGGVFPSADILNTNLTISGLTSSAPPLTVDYLVVAGGAGGGGSVLNYTAGGGGGAGGLRTSYTNSSSLNGHTESSLSLSTATNYTVTVGTGGAGANSSTAYGTAGSNSVFSTIAATGGGGGGTAKPTAASGQNGGSGGGTSGYNNTAGSAVTSPVTQGYAGGTAYGTSTGDGSGGGGGAAAVGQNGGDTSGGDGGSGLAVNIISTTNATSASTGEVSGSDVYFAGGGGGGQWFYNFGGSDVGTGGIGGGGDAGVANQDGYNGTLNTGGGAGGGSANNINNVTGGNGGSGVVIIRYPSGYSITVGSGITEASGSPFTEGSDKVSVFTGGTGNISFS
jgi:hypothetical protein